MMWLPPRPLVIIAVTAGFVLTSTGTSANAQPRNAAVEDQSGTEPTRHVGLARTERQITSVPNARTGIDNDEVTLESLKRDAKLLRVSLNLIRLLLGGLLLFSLQAGFALVETGLCRAKNSAHTAAMSLVVYSVCLLGYWLCGFAFQMGGTSPLSGLDGPNSATRIVNFRLLGHPFGILGYRGFCLAGDAGEIPVLSVFLLHMVFMNVAATIPTGALAERWRFSALTAYAVFMSTILYPIYACWVWGGGWLSQLGLNFGLGNGHVDLAGSTVVHMTGGIAALAGALILGSRIGKFNADGSANPIPGHNIPMVVTGTLILALGWFGINVAATVNELEGMAIRVALCTILASAAGCCTAMLSMWILYGKPDPTMGCNGLLAGLVAITAACAFITPSTAVLVGGLAGVLVTSSVLFVEKSLHLDDPVGAVSVHGVCGAFGALCVGLFADGSAGRGWNGVVNESPLGLLYGGGVMQFAAQLVGVIANLLWCFPVAFGFFLLLDRFWGIRVSARDEIAGLDVAELGVSGYVDEEPIDVKRAGQDHLSEHGPGVPMDSNKTSGRPGKPKRHGRP